MLEAADLVLAGKHTETVQDESQASYEGWCRAGEVKIDWAKPIDQVYNLIRGCEPCAWGVDYGQRQEAADLRRSQDALPPFCRRAGKIGEVTEVTAQSFKVTAQGGMIEVLKAKFEDGKKATGGEIAQSGGIGMGTLLG